MEPTGWTQLTNMTARCPLDASSIAAYSEFMPPPRFGRTSPGPIGESPFDAADLWGWYVAEHEEADELQPGLEQVAHQVLGVLARLVRGVPAHGLSRSKLHDNPYWPPDLERAARAGTLARERLVVVMPLALARTQDDKGRIRWTLFGGSEQGPARPFWRSFWKSPGRERPAAEALDFLARLLADAFGATASNASDLHRAGLRVLPQGDLPAPLPAWTEGPRPSWVRRFLLDEGGSLDGVRYLLSFRPFDRLPEAVRSAYLAGALHLIPSPACLIPWGEHHYLRLRAELPLAMQVPLLNLVARHVGSGGLRVPQSGWLHEPRPGRTDPGDRHGPLRNTYVRTHRAARSRRDEASEPSVPGREDRMAHVLFGTSERAMGLYGKPMARNAQLWTEDARLLLDGPRADRTAIEHAAGALAEGGLFGYRFQFPAMRVGDHEVYWQRPLVAYLSPVDDRATVVPGAPLGALTGYRADRPDPAGAIELWPRLRRRAPYVAAIELFRRPDDPRSRQTARDCRKLLEARAMLGTPLPVSFARRLLSESGPETLDDWLEALPAHAGDTERGRQLAEELRRGLADEAASPPGSLTFARTARRTFEVGYWRTIAALAGGRFPNRNQADCARDPATRAALTHHGRDLEVLGDRLLTLHRRSIETSGMTGRALAGDLPFHWRTDFDLDWSDGWLASQVAAPRERDLLVVIPGRDRSRAVIMADHYDTAYMEDRYHRDGVRLAAPGADDNTSATAALLMAAPVLLERSRQGRLGCDVWLVHLTGEEFPADCLGARHLAARLVAGDLKLRVSGRRGRDLSDVRVEGIFVLDMVAHETPRRRGVFEIAPGAGALRLALEAHRAVEAWNALATGWDRHPARRAARPRRGSRPGLPPIARHPRMIGEIRPHDDPHSTLYNTDAQIFSDAGIPAVLFMEDYDIDRRGYHDSQDTMAGIDLAYGAALAAIAVEAVARVAVGPSHAP
jgi:hypothetical protein